MGVISDILDSILGSGNEGSVHTKTDVKENDDGDIRVRNAAYISTDGTDKHSTIFSNTTSNINTGETSFKEGGHGENFQK